MLLMIVLFNAACSVRRGVDACERCDIGGGQGVAS